MFAVETDALLASLDAIVGSRDATREVIAWASGAVLTAAPHGAEKGWLKKIETQMTRFQDKLSDPASLILSCRRPHQSFQPQEDARARALHHLLHVLARDHGTSAPAPLERLSLLAARALSHEHPDRLKHWGALVRTAHSCLQGSYLTNHLELN